MWLHAVPPASSAGWWPAPLGLRGADGKTGCATSCSGHSLRHHRSQALATHGESTSEGFGKNDGMNVALIVIVLLMLFVPFVLVGMLFVWGAAKDGQEDRAVQRRLGIRRRTRLGR
jgi:hypothetical protein